MRWLQRAIEDLVRATEDVVDETAYVGEDGVGPEMTWEKLNVHLRGEIGTGRLHAMDARYKARVALKTFRSGDLEDAQRYLMSGQRSWIRAQEKVLHTQKRHRLGDRPNPGRRPKGEDVDLFRVASELREKDSSLTQAKACRAAMSAYPRLGLAYYNLTDAGLKAAFQRGRRKSQDT